MGIQLQLMLTIYTVNFGLTSLHMLNQMENQVVPSKINDESRIQENSRILLNSIAKHHANESKIYREILQQELVKERQAFDVMKDELQIARDRNTHKKINFYKESKVGEDVIVTKREADEIHRGPDYTKFKKLLGQARSIVVITGSGVSVESGIPLLRGANAKYKNREVRLIRTMTAFKENPSLVWDFINYQREIILTAKPNKAHYALVDFEKRCQREGRNFTLITQNTDGLHRMAGSQNLVEFYGSMLRTKCTVCGNTHQNLKSPICPAFGRRGHKPNATRFIPIPSEKLPRCEKTDCGGLLRPGLAFFGEDIDPKADEKTETSMRNCDLCLVIGCSAKFYPMTEFVNHLVWKRIPIAEFNTEATPQTSLFQFHFNGVCTKTVPEALA